MPRARFLVALATLCLLLLAARYHSRLAAAGEAAWTVLIDGTPTTVQVVALKSGNFLPLSFPLEKGDTSWEVRFHTDPVTHAVRVERKKVGGRKQRGDDERCFHCYGDGKCGECYPKGSGKNNDGKPCTACNGTGSCQFCKGTGKKS